MTSTPTPLLTSILEIHGLSRGARLALLGLLSYRNKATGDCFPSINKLRERLGEVSYSTAKRWLRELRLAGIVEATTSEDRASNSYQIKLSTSGKVPVDACAKPPINSRGGGFKNEPGVGSKMNRGVGSKMNPKAGSILYEQTVVEQTGGTAAAVTPRSVVDEPVEKAAAAAPPPSQQEAQHPASPPVDRQEQAQQLGFDLEPEKAAPVEVLPVIASPDIAPLAHAMARELLKVHPQPGLPNRAAPEIQGILRSAPNVEATAERIWNNHAAWMEYWKTLEAGRFIPQLWRWFHDGDWENPPVIRKPAQKESKLDAFAREYERRRATRRA